MIRAQHDLSPSKALNRLAHLPCLTIAAMEGPARGGGCEVALACDWRVTADDADLGFVQIRLGLTTGWGGAARLIQLVGYSRALDLLLLGRILSAPEAHWLGIVTLLTPPDEALKGALAAAEAVAHWRDPLEDHSDVHIDRLLRSAFARAPAALPPCACPTAWHRSATAPRWRSIRAWSKRRRRAARWPCAVVVSPKRARFLRASSKRGRTSFMRPRSWLTLESQLRYDLNNRRWRMSVHNLTLQPSDRWSWAIGHWYLRDDLSVSPGGASEDDNLIRGALFFKLNENWAFRAAHYYDLQDGRMEEQDYTVYRDLRSWTAGLTFRLRDNRDSSDDFTVAFTFSVKARPKFDLGSDAVGKRFAVGGPDDLNIAIIGVVADSAYSQVKSEIPPQYFRPRRQNDNLPTLFFYVRAGIEPDALMRAIPAVVSDIDPDLPVSNLTTMRRQMQDNVYLDRLVTLLKWDVASIPAGTTVTAASVTVQVLNPSTGTYNLLAMNAGWSEDSAAWENTNPPNNHGDVIGAFVPGENGRIQASTRLGWVKAIHI